MTDAHANVDYATRIPPPASQHVVVARLSFEETVNRLKHAIDAENLWLIHEIDPQMLLRRGGYRINATRQLLFFHPRYMARLLAIDANALIEAPLKLAIMEMPDKTVTVRYSDVATLFGEYDGFDELVTELSGVCQRLVETISIT